MAITRRLPYSKEIERRGLSGRYPLLFSAVHGRLEAGELARWALDDGLDVRLQIQLHKVLWPGVERGI